MSFEQKENHYARVIEILENYQLKGKCDDGEIRQFGIHPRTARRFLIKVGDIVLIESTGYQTCKWWCSQRYNPQEINYLHRRGIITDKLIFCEKTDADTEDKVNIHNEL